MRALILLPMLLVSVPALAAPSAERLFGPEFTFTNDSIIEEFNEGDINDVLQDHRDRLRSAIEASCAGRARTAANFCKVRFVGNDISKNAHWEVDYPNAKLPGRGNLKIRVTADPAVVESQITPMTETEWRKHGSMVQADLFEQAESVSLRPHRLEGGGHINMGYEYFSKRPKLLAALSADLLAHPELSQGGFGIRDQEDALAAGELSRKDQQKYVTAIEDLRAGRINPKEFARRVNEEVYRTRRHTHSPKHHALNLTTIPDERIPLGQKRIEFRPVTAQSSVDEFVRDIHLINARVDHLDRELAAGRFPAIGDIQVRRGPVDPQELANRMRYYVEETGLAWKGPGGYAERARGAWGEAVDMAIPSAGPCKTKPSNFIRTLTRTL